MLSKAVDLLEAEHPEAARVLVEGELDGLAYFAFPEAHWKTNPLERLNKELRRRVRSVGLFPDGDSVIRLLGALLVEQDDEWRAADRRYLSAESMALLQQPSTRRDRQSVLGGDTQEPNGKGHLGESCPESGTPHFTSLAFIWERRTRKKRDDCAYDQ